MFEGLLTYRGFGIELPPVKVLVNCMDYTLLAKDALAALMTTIDSGAYSSAPVPPVTLLSTQIRE